MPPVQNTRRNLCDSTPSKIIGIFQVIALERRGYDFDKTFLPGLHSEELCEDWRIRWNGPVAWLPSFRIPIA